MKNFVLTGILLGSLLLNPAAAAQTSLDTIVAIVDESVITRRELANRIRLVKIEQGTRVICHPPESRSRICLADSGYCINSHSPFRSEDILATENYLRLG